MLALGAMMSLGERELAAGHAETELCKAGRAIALNNMREDAHRLIVQALAATGRKAEALRHYQDLVALLKHELNTEPDAATRSLVAELRSPQPPARAPASCQPIARAPKPLARSAGDAWSASARGPERRQLTIMVVPHRRLDGAVGAS